MRLIDADALKKDLKSVTLSNGTLVNTNAVLYLLEEYPTAYDPDKIVEQLEEVEKIMTSPVNKDCFGEECRASDCTVCLISKAIEIVKGGGVE